VDSEVIPYHGRHRMLVVDGLATSYLEAGDGPPLILLHSGEFGACAELSWEFNIEALSGHFRVIAPDWLGYGRSAKVHDFTLGTGLLIRHLRRFCEVAGITMAPFVGNSIAAGMLLSDAASDQPELPASAIVAIAGGGDVAVNEHVDALFAYDCSVEAMQRLLKALFHSPKWFDDPDYLKRRHELSLIPGSWECVAAARFRSPAAQRPGSQVRAVTRPMRACPCRPWSSKEATTSSSRSAGQRPSSSRSSKQPGRSLPMQATARRSSSQRP
jgi:2-hydroxymuconate-semialdehyde hydrolase